MDFGSSYFYVGKEEQDEIFVGMAVFSIMFASLSSN